MELKSTTQLAHIFQNNLDRSVFIADYESADDHYDAFFISFIAKNIGNNRAKAQEDAIELSIKTRFYSDDIERQIISMLNSRRTDWIKLLCLDWLYNFFDRIPKETFEKTNYKASRTAKNDLVKLRCLLNLLLLDSQSRILTEQLLNLLENANDPALFYRVINGMAKAPLISLGIQIKSSIDKNKYLQPSQKAELDKRINAV